jgi:hypothetical protein
MAAKKAAKPAKKTTALSTGALRPQPHGGALRNGGTNKGGTGRPPSEIRAMLRGSFSERVKILEQIADSADASAADRIKAVDMLAKYGLGTQQEVVGDPEKPQELRVRFVHEDTL